MVLNALKSLPNSENSKVLMFPAIVTLWYFCLFIHLSYSCFILLLFFFI